MVGLAGLYSDRVTLVKANGDVSRTDLLAICEKGSIQLHDGTLPIEAGDHLLRKLPNGMVEDYTVIEPTLHSGLGITYYEVSVRKASSVQQTQPAAVQQITNIFHGANSRANINSTDNSTNVNADHSTIDRLQAAVECDVPAGVDRDALIEAIASLKGAANSPERLSAYQRLVAAGANHMTVLAPFIPALSQLLG